MVNAPDINFNMRANAGSAIQSINMVNSQLVNINGQLAKATASTGMLKTSKDNLGSSIRGLALRFVGYNLVLNQVLSLQQKVVSAVQESVQAFREFELRMAEVSTIIGDEELPMMDKLTQGVQALSQAYGKSSSDMAKGLYDILSAAFSVSDSLNLLTTSTKAAIAGLSDIRTSVDIFTTVLNAYGMTVQQATHVSDILFQSVVRGKFQFEDLESALGYVVPIAAQVGVSFEELMASLSTATRFGLHIDMASRGLAMAIQGIVNPSNEAAKAAEKYGIEMSGLALEVLGLEGWFTQLNKAADQFGSQILSEIIPNIRSLRVAMVLAGDEGLKGFNDDLGKLADMGAATEKALNKIKDTSSFVASQLQQQMEQVKREVGEDWDDLTMNIQRGVLTLVKLVTGKDYTSTVANAFKVSDDDFKNIQTYFKIEEEINSLVDKRLTMETTMEEIRKEPVTGYIDMMLKGVSLFLPFFKEVNIFEKLQKQYDNLGTDIQALITRKGDLESSINNVVGAIQSQLQVLDEYQTKLNDISNSIVEYEKELKSPTIYGWGKNLKTASVSIEEFTYLTEEQRKAVERLGGSIGGTLAYEWELLKANQAYADASHDVEMGLKMENYNYKVLPENIRAAIDATREYTEAQKENKKATEQMSAALRILQIEQLEIELRGMMRRRGLTRAEERRLKQIQIEEAKIRLENMKNIKMQTVEEVTSEQERETLIDDYLLKLQEEQYVIQYNYDQQIKALEETIGAEAVHLTNRYDWWKLINGKIIEDSTSLTTQLKTLLSDPAITAGINKLLEDTGLKINDILAQLEKVKSTAATQTSKYESIPYGSTPIPTSQADLTYRIVTGQVFQDFENLMHTFPKLHTGVSYVPATRPYLLEKGETVMSKNADVTAPIMRDITVNINNPQIADKQDIAALSKSLENVLRANLYNDKYGRNKHRMA